MLVIVFAETPRTILREITLDDVDGFYELDSDPEVHKYLGTIPIVSKEQIVDIIHFIRQQYADNGIGRWAVIEKESNKFIGWSGLKLVTDTMNNHTNYYDLGYRFIRTFWGKGFATETALASVAYCFDTMNLQEIIATVHRDNTGSNQVVKKIGFIRCEAYDLHGLPHNWYTMNQREWLSRLKR